MAKLTVGAVDLARCESPHLAQLGIPLRGLRPGLPPYPELLPLPFVRLVLQVLVPTVADLLEIRCSNGDADGI
eukprot:8863552-Pyramimonas_sp.AAC.1